MLEMTRSAAVGMTIRTWLIYRWSRLWERDTHWAEVLIAGFMVGRGAVWVLPGADMSSPIYDSMSLLLDPFWWGAIYLAAGALLAYSVWLNGSHRTTSLIRAATLTFAFGLNFFMAFSFAGAETGGGNQGFMSAAVLTVGCFCCALRVSFLARN